MLELKGICPILAAPFREDGALDEPSLTKLIDFLVGCGVHGITLFGLAGEYYKLTDEERGRIRQVLLAQAEHKTVRIVSITDHAIEIARERAREAEAAGADALMVMPPFFLAPGADAISYHLREIAKAVRIPVVAQYSPQQTGISLSPSTLVRLTDECPNLRYVKVDAMPPGPMISKLVAESRGGIKTFVGYAGLQMPDAFARGAVGCMPGGSLSEIYVKIYDHIQRGEGDAAFSLHARLLPLVNFMMQSLEMSIRTEKTILAWRGIIASDYCRRPRVDLDSHDLRHLKRLYREVARLL
ncbi:MAG: dihydrodipicolinate synthase family protein [Terriglobia bacterium]